MLRSLGDSKKEFLMRSAKYRHIVEHFGSALSVCYSQLNLRSFITRYRSKFVAMLWSFMEHIIENEN